MKEYFPKLNLNILKLFANRWVSRYSRVPIELILLTKHNDIRWTKDYLEDRLIRKGIEPVRIKEAKYDIKFIVSYDKVLFNEARIGYTGEEYSEYCLQIIKGEIKPNALQNFLDNVGYVKNKNRAQYQKILTQRFQDEVYKEPPNSILWWQDWDINVILQNHENDYSLPPEMEYEPYIVLYADSKWSLQLDFDKKAESQCNNDTSQNIQQQNSKDFEKTDSPSIQNNETKKNSSSLLPCPQGTKWNDIKITLTSKDQVRIKTPEGEKTLHYAAIGMEDGRSPENKKRIWALLILFAENNGEIDLDKIKENKHIFGNPNKDSEKQLFDKFMSATKELNKHLKNVFGINDSIYLGSYKKMWKNESTLQTHFPRLFIPIKPFNGVEDLDRLQTIRRRLKRKGYATKITFASKLDYPIEKADEKILFEQEVETSERKKQTRGSKVNTSYNPI